MKYVDQAKKKELLEKLIRSLRESPTDWSWQSGDDRYTINHVSGVELWVRFGGVHVWRPHKVYFGWLGKMRLRSAFRYWRRVRGRKEEEAIERQHVQAVLDQFTGRRLRSVA